MLPPKRFVRRQMRIRQHPTYRHRQLCTIVAIICNLSKFETIFYRLPWQIAIARARRSRDAPRRVLFLWHWLSAKPIRQWLRLSRSCRPRRQELNTPTRRRYLARPTGGLNTRRIWAPNPPALCAFHRITAPSLARPFRIDSPLPRYRKNIDKISTASVSI